MSRKTTLALAILFLFAGLAVALRFAHGRWQRTTLDARARMASALRPIPPQGREDTLPAPVRRYLALAAPASAAPVRSVRMAHEGSFRTSESPNSWRPFSATQLTTTAPPGFDWDARVYFAPGLPIYVRDGYVLGRGALRASILGLWVVAQGTAGELTPGQLLRYLAESVWYPTALRPGLGIDWEPLSDSSARATLRDSGHSATADFHFGPDGLVREIAAPARGRLVNGRYLPTPWTVRPTNYQPRHGLLIPTQAEVAWTLPSGPLPYWRGRITSIRFE